MSPEDNRTEYFFKVYFIDGDFALIDLQKLRKYVQSKDLLVMDLVQDACCMQKIHPRNAIFFGLQTSSFWLPYTKKVCTLKNNLQYTLRLQYKNLDVTTLRKRDDASAYSYYLIQCRNDFKNGIFARMLDKKGEIHLLRMVILELLLVAEDTKKARNKVLELLTKHKYKQVFNIKGILSKNHVDNSKLDTCISLVKKNFDRFKDIVDPGYDFILDVEELSSYKEKIFFLTKSVHNASIHVQMSLTPNYVKETVVESTGAQSVESPYKFFKLIKVHNYVEGKGREIIIQKNQEKAEQYCMMTDELADTFCSFFDGYYRLNVDQYTSLTDGKISRLFYHGPLERESAEYLLSRNEREAGNYLFRQHCKKFRRIVMSLVGNDEKFKHFEIDQSDDGWSFCGVKSFESLKQLEEFYSDPLHEREIEGVLKTVISPENSGELPLYCDPKYVFPPLPSRIGMKKKLLSDHPTSFDPTEILPSNYLKKGGFKDVILCKKDNILKILTKINSATEKDMNALGETLNELKYHKHILQCLSISLLANDPILIYEYLPLGNLERHLKRAEIRRQVTFGALINYLYQLTDAVNFLHSKKLIHGDLRLSNIFVHEPNVIKLADSCLRWIFADRDIKTRCSHLAPEMVTKENWEQTFATDIWAYGLTVWQLFTLETPFKNFTFNDLKTFYGLHLRNPTPGCSILVAMNMNCLPYCPEKLMGTLAKSLCVIPEERMSIAGIFSNMVDFAKDSISTFSKKQLYFVVDWEATLCDKKVEDEAIIKAMHVNDANTAMRKSINMSMVYGQLDDGETMETEINAAAKTTSVPGSPSKVQCLSKSMEVEDNEIANASKKDVVNASGYVVCDLTKKKVVTNTLKKQSQEHDIASILIGLSQTVHRKENGEKSQNAKKNTVPTPPSTPPDSPESVKKELSLEQTGKDEHNDGVRLFLQRRMERERYCGGKRRMSFKEIMDEYKAETKRVAKKALTGPNPYNIGVNLSHPVLKAGKRESQKSFNVSPEILKFFKLKSDDSPTTTKVYKPTEEPKKGTELTDFNGLRASSSSIHNSTNYSISIPNAHILASNSVMRPVYQIPPQLKTSSKKKKTKDNMKQEFNVPPPAGYPVLAFKHLPPHTHPRLFAVNATAGRLPPPLHRTRETIFLPHPIHPVMQAPMLPRVVRHPNEPPVFISSENACVSYMPIDTGLGEGGLFRFVQSSDVTMEVSLGEGQLGEVFKGQWKFKDKNQITHHIPVAIKKLRYLDDAMEISTVHEFRNEARNMASLSGNQKKNSKFLVMLYGVCTEGENAYLSIITELFPLGSINKFVFSKKNDLNICCILSYCLQIASGMEYLHKNQYLNRDLSCRNVMVFNKELVKISDIGLARFFADKGLFRGPLDEASSLRWFSLESIERKEFSFDTDRWSYGVTIWELFSLFDPSYNQPKVQPYENIEAKRLSVHLRQGHRLLKPTLCLDELWTLVTQCWKIKSDDRPHFVAFLKVLKELLEKNNYVQ